MKIAREGWPIVAGVGLVGLAAGVFWLPAGFFFLAFLVFTLWFFRDPERKTPGDPDALISPADGRVIRAGTDRISIFMNVFNVHVCRAPTAGRVVDVTHTPGRFLSAFKDAASEQNERASIVLESDERTLRFTLVAGLIARRIVCRVSEGRRLVAGERVGLIRFGSRVDVDLPVGANPAVQVGDRVVAGESILAGLAAERQGIQYSQSETGATDRCETQDA